MSTQSDLDHTRGLLTDVGFEFAVHVLPELVERGVRELVSADPPQHPGGLTLVSSSCHAGITCPRHDPETSRGSYRVRHLPSASARDDAVVPARAGALRRRARRVGGAL